MTEHTWRPSLGKYRGGNVCTESPSPPYSVKRSSRCSKLFRNSNWRNVGHLESVGKNTAKYKEYSSESEEDPFLDADSSLNQTLENEDNSIAGQKEVIKNKKSRQTW